MTSIGESAFYKCYGLTSITIPNSVTSIGYFAFSYCSSLTSVILGTGLKNIGSHAFDGCCALKEMVCHSTDFINCDGNLFCDSSYESGTLYVPASLIGEYRTTYPWYNWGSIKTLDDWAAGIEFPATSTDASPIYDLQGRRQSSMRKGINIIGGKKYLAK